MKRFLPFFLLPLALLLLSSCQNTMQPRVDVDSFEARQSQQPAVKPPPELKNNTRPGYHRGGYPVYGHPRHYYPGSTRYPGRYNDYLPY